MNRTLRSTMWGACAVSAIAIAGCGGPELQDAPPPPSAYVEPPMAPPAAAPQGRVETTELLGGPPPAQGGQSYARTEPAPAPVYASMAPIANPEDMSPAERARVYGRAETASATSYGSPAYEPRARATRTREGRTVNRVRQPDRPTVYTTARAPARPTVAAPSGPVTSRPVAPAPKVAAPKAAAPKTAAPVAPKIAAKPAPVPAKPLAPAPAKPAAPAVAKAPTPVPAKPVKPQTKAEQLGAAVAADVTSGAKFDIPAAVTAGQEGVVVLTLPQGLLGRIQAEAAKLGMTVPARTVDTRASLKGEGYTIVPNASQAARLKAGEATSFAWQVKPGAGVKGPLTAEVGGELKGGAKPVAFPITSIEQVVAPPVPAEPVKKGFDWKKFFGMGKDKVEGAADKAGDVVADGAGAVADGADAMADGAGAAAAKGKSFIDRIAIPGNPTVTLPTGPVRSGYVVLAGIGVLALLILSALGNAAGRRRRAAERRRKFRTMADFSASEPATTEHVVVHHEPAVEERREPEHA
jgi:hypothetical protein